MQKVQEPGLGLATSLLLSLLRLSRLFWATVFQFVPSASTIFGVVFIIPGAFLVITNPLATRGGTPTALALFPRSFTIGKRQLGAIIFDRLARSLRLR